MNKKIIFLVLTCSVLSLTAYAAAGESGRKTGKKNVPQVALDPDEDIYRGVVFGADKKTYEGSTLGARKPIVKKRVYDTSLIRAIKVGDADRVKTLLYARVDANEKNFAGITPLAVAAEKGDMNIIRLLVENGKANVDDKSSFGVTPLIAASAMGRGEVITYLVEEHNADVTAKDDKGKTALLYAVRFNQPRAVESLIKFNNSTVNLPDNDGNSPLIYAAQRGLLENVKILIKYGANPDYRNPLTGMSPLLAAAAGGHDQVVRTLVKNGGAYINLPDKSGRSAVFYAVDNNQAAALRMLISLKANINEQDLAGTTPLMVASAKNSQECMDILLRQKRKIRPLKTDSQGRNALFYSAYADDTAPASRLLGAGLDLNSRDQADNTPLLTAIKAKNERLALFFLQQGADLTISNKAKENAFTLTRRFLPRTTFASVLDVKRAETEQQLLQVEAQRLAEVRSLEQELAENEATAQQLQAQQEAAKQAAAEQATQKAQAAAEQAQDVQEQVKQSADTTSQKLQEWAEEDPELLKLQKELAAFNEE